jgi:ABC-type transport system substrate-binding protein
VSLRGLWTLLLLSLVAILIAVLSWWASRGLASTTFAPALVDVLRPRPQGDWLVGAFPEPRDLNPFTTSDATVRRWVLRFTHDTLRELEPRTGAVRPALATAIDVDGSEWRIRLRADARFADGTPVSADDVAFSHRCAKHAALPAGAMRAAAMLVGELQVVGPHELRARAVAPHWAAVDQFACGLGVFSKRHVLERLAAIAGAASVEGSAEFATALARLDDPGPGSGPYTLRRDQSGALVWARGQQLDLVQNPHSWRRRVLFEAWNLAGMRLRFAPDVATRLAMLRRGELDWLADGDLRALAAEPEFAARFRLATYDYVALGHFMVVWNCRRAPVDDPRVRVALARLLPGSSPACPSIRPTCGRSPTTRRRRGAS